MDEKEQCQLCGHITWLLDGLCRRCNPESHEWADEEEAQQLEQQLWEG